MNSLTNQLNQENLKSFKNLNALLNPESQQFSKLDDFKALVNFIIHENGSVKELNFWEKAKNKNKQNLILTYIHSPHHGQCTGEDIQCVRCLAETFYNIPNSMALEPYHAQKAYESYGKLFIDITDEFQKLEPNSRINKQDLMYFFENSFQSGGLSKPEFQETENKIIERIRYLLSDKFQDYLSDSLKINLCFPNDIGGDFGDGGFPTLNPEDFIEVNVWLTRNDLRAWSVSKTMKIPLHYFWNYNFEYSHQRDHFKDLSACDFRHYLNHYH
jgi:hypothetical protein